MINRKETTLYELNAQGVNRWYAGVHAGHDDSGNRTAEKELDKVAAKLCAVDDLYEALKAMLNDGVWVDGEWIASDDARYKAHDALEKARGEV